jgi:hypothetical protein
MTKAKDISRIRADFLRVIEKKNPQAFKSVVAALAKKELGPRGLGFVRNPVTGLYGLGAVDVTVGTSPADAIASEPSTFDKFLSTFKEILPAYANYQLTRDLYDLNLERAKMGLPPVNAQDVSPQLNVGISRDTQNMLIIGGIAIVAVFLLSRKRG